MASIPEIERVIGVLGDSIDQLESMQAIDPSPAIEAVADNVRFARDRLARILAAHFDALEEFVREHPVSEPYDPDVYDVEK